MEIKLLKHNEEAYLKILDFVKEHKKVAINHATGTGKSFIMAKYLYNNKDKRILYLAPTYQILDQFKEEHINELGISLDEFFKIDFKTYRSIMYKDAKELLLNYDIIVADEYHRCGAKKQGIIISQIYNLIDSYDNKLLFGTTATDTRYLDNERNMTEELFDGVCASKLSLADAIIRGILPAPCYYSYPSEIIKTIDSIKKRVNETMFYSVDKDKYLKELEDIKIFFRNSFSKDEVNKFIDFENGKYVVFCSTIANIAKVKCELQEMFLEKQINSMIVASSISKEKNRKTLKEFRQNNNGANFLFAVNLLNEGVHVKGIDAIFMYRKTKSPIIYFQQLGRLLSYSGRKDKLYVFDMVNNLENHQVIYQLYNEVCERVKILLQDENLLEEDRIRYLKILDNFKIVDKSSYVLSLLNKIKIELTDDVVLSRRVSTAVKILTQKITSTKEEKIQAHIDLFKYFKELNLDQFKELYDLNIVKPNIFKLTVLEFEQLLAGKSNLREVDTYKLDTLLDKIEVLVSKDKVLSLFSEDKEVRDFSLNVSMLCWQFNSKQKKRFLTLLKKMDNLKPLTALDKVSYNMKITSEEKEIAFKLLDGFLKENKELPRYLNQFLNNGLKDNKRIAFSDIDINALENEEKRDFILFSEFITKNNGSLPKYNETDILEQELFLKMKVKYFNIFEEYERIFTSVTSELLDLEEEEKIKKIYKFLNKYLKFVNENKRQPQIFNKNEIDFYASMQAYNNLLSKYDISLDDGVHIVKEEIFKNKKKDYLLKLESFLKENYGDFPDVNSTFDDEKKLALEFNRLKLYFSDIEKEEVEKLTIQFKEGYNFLEKYTDFIKKHKREPILSSDDIDEVRLVRAYLRREDSLTSDEKSLIKSAFDGNKRKVLKNTYIEMLKRRGK